MSSSNSSSVRLMWSESCRPSYSISSSSSSLNTSFWSKDGTRSLLNECRSRSSFSIIANSLLILQELPLVKVWPVLINLSHFILFKYNKISLDPIREVVPLSTTSSSPLIILNANFWKSSIHSSITPSLSWICDSNHSLKLAELKLLYQFMILLLASCGSFSSLIISENGSFPMHK